MYEFHRDNEGRSWRLIGLTARHCIELGLHRRETYDAIQDSTIRTETMLLFWAVYVLDRRWSFGTGMPFALHDADIDPKLPRSEQQSPYLSAMVRYSAIGAEVWGAVGSAASAANVTGEPININMDDLDYQVISWHRTIPADLQFEHPSQRVCQSVSSGPMPSRGTHRLRALLYLRANQMRILIYRPVLHSATSITQHREKAHIVVGVAQDTIRVLTDINQTSDLYRTQQTLFNAFLTSALAVLFLAVAHTPADFVDSVRQEFNMALNLVRGFSKGSWVSKRLWKTIRHLKEVGAKLGLASSSLEVRKSAHAYAGGDQRKKELDPSRSAAVAMAGLAGHNVDELALHQQGGNGQRWSVASSSPGHMANDLTSLFEAAEGLQAGGQADVKVQARDPTGPYGASNEGANGKFAAPEAVVTGDEGLVGVLRELF